MMSFAAAPTEIQEKEVIEQLAIFGGPPTFSQPVHVGRPNIGDRECLRRRIEEVLDSKWLTNNGRQVQEFEARIAEYVGVRHCIATCNATIALSIVVRALGLSHEVIVPAFTFVALPHALEWQGITPVFCDIDPVSHHLDANRVEALIGPRTTGICGVHLWGSPCNIDRLQEIAYRRNLRLFFDAAHAFGSSYRDRMVGSFGDAEIFSFHATKVVNAFEGGAVTTNDDELADKIRLMRNFGFTDYDTVEHVGTNGKMCEVSAAMGLTSLEDYPRTARIYREHFEMYRQSLDALPGVRFVLGDGTEEWRGNYVVLEIDEALAPLDRDQLLKTLTAENVLARRYFYPGCHRMEPYRTRWPASGRHLPATERASASVLCLPTGSALDSAEIAAICRLLQFIFANGFELNARLQQG